ncbi:MAG TPA: DUF2179 domain-containing protein [Pseudomonadota bacterium]|jgi:uncharacterized protein YebE (UPF0316 family)|nr:DUF2179 domain-containing protein [Pseudomonadota bacterium]
MPDSVLLSCLVVFLARVSDVSLGTLRVVMVTQGRRGRAALLGFLEVLIWVFAVSKVLGNLQKPMFAVAYAAGFACGNYVGLTLERWAAMGKQAVRVFSRRGEELADRLRQQGFRVTVFHGMGRDGPVHMLYAETERRKMPCILSDARRIDPQCFYVVDDVRIASSAEEPPPSRFLFGNPFRQRK